MKTGEWKGFGFAGGIAGKEDWVVDDMKDEELEGDKDFLFIFLQYSGKIFWSPGRFGEISHNFQLCYEMRCTGWHRKVSTAIARHGHRCLSRIL